MATLVASKSEECFRNYADSKRHDVVSNHYRMMRMHQTLSFAQKMANKYDFTKPRAMMTIHEAFDQLKVYVDSSDPDTLLPNALHMLQTAEGIREAGHPDWMQLVGLLHDMGKIMFLWGDEEDGQVGTADGPQWALGGDTWVVGCRIPDCVVFPEFSMLNPDMQGISEPTDESESDPTCIDYSTPHGKYTANCGIDNLTFAYGHDEYMYQMLVANNALIPEMGLSMVRYHSCYAWHTGGAYREFMAEKDYETLKWVLEFNKSDLYTKTFDESSLDEGKLWEYYDALLAKYGLEGPLKW